VRKLSAILLMPAEFGALALALAKEVGLILDAVVVNDLSALQIGCERSPELLLSFCTGVIVPESILASPNMLAINIHTASPEYPGRDPHHFASYDRATRYGATMHYMTARVDDGPIIDIEIFDVNSTVKPAQLLARSSEAGLVLMRRLFSRLEADKPMLPMKDMHWGQRKSTRKMFLDMCKVDSNMSLEEFNRRLHATSMPGYSNLFVEIHGRRFRLMDAE
jgi:methionyl-tRNA formyltransferase